MLMLKAANNVLIEAKGQPNVQYRTRNLPRYYGHLILLLLPHSTKNSWLIVITFITEYQNNEKLKT